MYTYINITIPHLDRPNLLGTVLIMKYLSEKNEIHCWEIEDQTEQKNGKQTPPKCNPHRAAVLQEKVQVQVTVLTIAVNNCMSPYYRKEVQTLGLGAILFLR